MPRGGIHQTSVSTRMRSAVAGMPEFADYQNETDFLINADPQAAEIWTLTIDTATDNEDYSVLLTDPAAEATIDSGAGSSVTSVALALATAWNNAPIARGMATAVAAGGVIVFTGIVPGLVFAMTEGDNAAKMTLVNTTNAAEADSVPFGRLMIALAYQANYSDKLGIRAKSTAFSAQVDVVTIVDAASQEYNVAITVEGKTYTDDVTRDTNLATTLTALAAAINLIMPAATSVLADGSSGTTLVLTAEVAGKGFETNVGSKTGGNIVLTSSTNGITTDIEQAFAGISQYSTGVPSNSLPSSTSDDASYPANSGVTAQTKGNIWVEVDSGISVTLMGDVRVEMDGSANSGRLYTVSSATRIKLPKSLISWIRNDFSGSDSPIALVSVHRAA